MRNGIQTFLIEVGEAACYGLCLIEVSMRQRGPGLGDPISLLEQGINRKFIRYNWDNPDDDNNFYIEKPAEFLSYLLGEKWTVRKEDPSYTLKPGEIAILRYERPTPKMIYTHFRLKDWDPLLRSETVRLGRIASLRVCARAV